MRWLPLLLVAVLCSSPRLEAAEWRIDQRASRIEFTATFEGAEFGGTLTGITGTVVFDPDSPDTGRFDVAVDVRSADTGSSDLNEGMALSEWFDFARHPAARFVSERIASTAPARYETSGQLTIKGIHRAVTLPFTFAAQGESAEISGTTTLRRTDFNIGAGAWATDEAIGIAVKLAATIALTKAN